MKILSIDPSTKSTGVAIFEDGKLISYKCISATSENLFKRIRKMQEEIRTLIETEKINAIYIEDVLPEDVKGNRTVFKALMYLQGYLCEVFKDFGITPIFYFPNEWRSKLGIHTGRGVVRESLKPQDIAFVKRKYGIEVNDDIADAICIGCAALTKEKVTSGGFEFK